MSVTDDPDDFVRWLKEATRPRRVLNWTREDFAPRSYFADYLQDRLADVRAASNLHISWLHTTADSVSPHGAGWEVILAHGDPLIADVVILATGNEAPRVIGGNLPPSVQRLGCRRSVGRGAEGLDPGGCAGAPGWHQSRPLSTSRRS